MNFTPLKSVNRLQYLNELFRSYPIKADPPELVLSQTLANKGSGFSDRIAPGIEQAEVQSLGRAKKKGETCLVTQGKNAVSQDHVQWQELARARRKMFGAQMKRFHS